MSIYKGLDPIDLAEIQTYELATRPSKVTVNEFAKPVHGDDSLRAFLGNLPDILAVRSLRGVSQQIRRAKDLGKPVIWGFGGHVVKTGLAPVVIDLARRGYVTAIATNG